MPVKKVKESEEAQVAKDPTAPQVEEVKTNDTFTGVSRSLQTYFNQGNPHYKIVTLHLVNGKVTQVEYSIPYASFEVLHKMEQLNTRSFDHMRSNWRVPEEDGVNFKK